MNGIVYGYIAMLVYQSVSAPFFLVKSPFSYIKSQFFMAKTAIPPFPIKFHSIPFNPIKPC